MMKPGNDYVGVAVGAVILDETGKYLIAKRGAKAKNERGKWEFVGGQIEYMEEMEAAIKREVKEELNIEVEIIGKLGTFNHLLPEEGQHWVSTTFVTKFIGGELKIMEPEKCTGLKWVEFDDLESYDLSVVTKLGVDLLKQNNKR